MPAYVSVAQVRRRCCHVQGAGAVEDLLPLAQLCLCGPWSQRALRHELHQTPCLCVVAAVVVAWRLQAFTDPNAQTAWQLRLQHLWPAVEYWRHPYG